MVAPVLIYCASGNCEYGEIAITAGFRYGARLPGTVYHPVYFADQDWKKPDRVAYMAALTQHKPRMATVLDLEREEQLPEVLSWAEEAAQWVQQVVIIPKVCGTIDAIPERIGTTAVVLGYSVPTAYGGTGVPVWEFGRRPVHLLGGSPQRQLELAGYLNVVSADGNMAAQQSRRCRFWSASKGSRGHWVQLSEIGDTRTEGAHVECFRRSCLGIYQAWQRWINCSPLHG